MDGIAKSAKGNCKDAENKLHQTLCNYFDLKDGVDIGDDTRVWIFPCKAVWDFKPVWVHFGSHVNVLWDAPNFSDVQVLPCKNQEPIKSTSIQSNRKQNKKI